MSLALIFQRSKPLCLDAWKFRGSLPSHYIQVPSRSREFFLWFFIGTIKRKCAAGWRSAILECFSSLCIFNALDYSGEGEN